MKRIFTLLLYSFLLQILPANAQTSSGTEFWLAYMENLNLTFNDAPVFAIHLSSAFTTTGSISVPATGYTQPFSINAGQQLEVVLPPAIWYSENSEVVEGKGIQITSGLPIEVSATHFRLYFTEATGVLPTTELSDEYLTTCFFPAQNALFPSSFVVVATADGTLVEITPRAFTLGLHAANVPFTVTLDQGEIYQVQALGDLTGSRVRAVNGEKIVVFSGAQQAVVGSNCTGSADNHLYEQCQPFSNWSDLYYFVPFKNQGGDLVRILAKEDNTTVYFDCDLTVVLQEGEFFQTKISQATVISSTAPIAVTQFNESQDCNSSGIGDPSMMTLIPTRNQSFRSAWRATPGTMNSQSQLSSHFTNVIMRTADTGSILLDGNGVAANFSPFPADPTLSFAQLTVTEGDHQLTATAPFHAYHYGFGDFDAYTKTGAYQQITDLEFACLEIEAEGFFCVDSVINFSATSNFDIVSYDWQTSDGQSSISENPGFTFTTPGDYNITLTAANADGDVQTETYTLTIADCPNDPCDQVVFLSIEATGACASAPTLLTYNSTLAFLNVEWDFGDGTPISTDEAPSHFYAVGIYNITFTGYDALNCAYTQTLNFEITDCGGCGDPILILSVEGDLCAGEVLTFSSNIPNGPLDGPYDVFWNFSNGVFTNDLEAQVVFDTPGFYVVTLQIIDLFEDCFYNGNLEIEIEDCSDPCNGFVINNINIDGDLCVFSETVFSADVSEPVVSYSWDFGGVPFSQSDSLFITFLEAGELELELTVTNADGCVATESITFMINDCIDPCLDLLPISISANGTSCLGDLFSATAVTDANLVNYQWFLNEEAVGFNSNLYEYTTTEIGINTLRILAEDGNGCIYETTLDVEVIDCTDPCLDFEIENINTSGIYCRDSIVIFSANDLGAGTNYLWTYNNIAISENLSASISFTEIGNQTIYLNVSNTDGCLAEDSLIITIEACTTAIPCESIYVPNAFSPNDDSINDVFKPLSNCPPDNYELRIYSRWGGLVFQTNDFEESWDGTLKGEVLQPGVFAWVMTFSFGAGEVSLEKGDVLIMR